MISLLLLAQTPTPSALFDRAIQAISRSEKGAFSVAFDSRENQMARKGKYEVAYIRPNRLKVRSLIGRTDRTFTLVGSTVFGLDAVAKEHLTTPAGTKGSAADRMGVVVAVDEPVRILVDPGVGKTFLSTFKDMPGWRVARISPPLLELAEDRGRFSIGFDGSGRLASVRVAGPAGVLGWNYAYGAAPSRIAFAAPKGFRKVKEFYDLEPEREPKYVDAGTRRVLENCLRAYSRLREVGFSVSDPASTYEVWVSRPKARQRSAAGEWAWDGKTLRVALTRARTYRSGAATWTAAESHLARYGLGIDPMVRRLARKQNPISSILGADMRARTVGQIGVGGVRCDIVELAAPGVRVSLTIRRDNGLLLATATENLDRQGKVLARSERRFTYRSIGNALPASMFNLPVPAGYAKARL